MHLADSWGDLNDEMSLVSCKEVTEDIDKATFLSKSGHKKLRFHCRNDVRNVREAEKFRVSFEERVIHSGWCIGCLLDAYLIFVCL